MILISVSHDKEFVWKNRGYKNVYEMNLDLMTKWNATVNADSEVYLLGDVMLNDTEEGMRILQNLKGNIHIIAGNHDTAKRLKLYQESQNIVDIKYADLLRISKRSTFYLSHYPTMMTNINDRKKIWCLSGHTHTIDKFALKEHQIYNIGVDAHNGFPVSIEEVLEDLRRLKEN